MKYTPAHAQGPHAQSPRVVRAPAPGLLISLAPFFLGVACGTHQAEAPGTDTDLGSSPTELPTQPHSPSQADALDDTQPPIQGFEVLARFPHDPRSYTQGLVFADGRFLESTGRNGTSRLLEVRLDSGAALREVDLPYQFFAEGLALHKGELFQLTWKSGRVFVYDRRSFESKRELSLKGEGWGIASDGEHLVVSNGTDVLQFVDPQTFEVLRRVSVKSGARPVRDLNELEYVEGEIYANVWKKNLIARIDPEDGRVLAWIDLSNLMDFTPPRDSDAVLNGIAYDAKRKRLFVTGKLWPTLYEIRVLPG